MAESDTEIVRRAFEAFNEEGTEALIPYTHSDFEFSTPPDLASEPDTYRGHEGVRRYFDSFFEVMDEIKVEPSDIHMTGDVVVMAFVLRARGQSTGIPTEQQAFAVMRLDDGLLISLTFHPNSEEAEAEARNLA